LWIVGNITGLCEILRWHNLLGYEKDAGALWPNKMMILCHIDRLIIYMVIEFNDI
jgi:hypothetical protein